MELRKLIIYLVFAATVAYGVHFHFLANRDREISGQFEPGGQLSASPADVQGNLQARIGSGMDHTANQDLEWKRNPFRNDRRVEKKAVRSSTPRIEVPDKPTISAISRTGGQVMVVADGRVLRIGEKTGPWRLVDVRNDAALFDGPGGRTWIRLGGSK
jgi:hypothetical protein